jgi:signal transduction histidine kinase
MGTRALIPRAGTSRAWIAAGLLVALLAVLLGAWFVSGWHDVKMRQVEVRQAPRSAATSRVAELGRELHGELEALLAREVRRPYFHYQNLMHDPKGSVGLSVSPSPLAQGVDDKLVLGYFQVDAKGRTTTPTINDEVPELSEPAQLATNRAFRDQVSRELAGQLMPSPTLVAQAPAIVQQQVIDSNSYVQNSNAAAVYWNQLDNANEVKPRVNVDVAPPRAATQITITVSPLEWRTLPFGGLPTLVAVRQVQTPDGTLAQGFVVDRATLTGFLAGKAGELVAELHAGGGPTEFAHEVAPGWHLTVTPNPRTLTRAAAAASDVARSFIIRFSVVGVVAVLTAALVLLLVMRAEKLARERSQFAAAAAHELRTPLAGLQLYGDMLADGLGDPGKLRDYAKRMSEEAARLGRVVSNVLGFSQLERGNLSIDAKVGSLGEALCELAERAQPALDRAGAVLDLDVAPDLRARFDKDALARIVGNLLDNAEKYTRDIDDRTIGLSARTVGDRVDVIVRDKGPGIADPARLFKPFERGVPDDGPAGLGLGLTLSHSLAHAMGGTLSYRTADGGGAELVLSLPAAEP